jgi:hypothetical protein
MGRSVADGHQRYAAPRRIPYGACDLSATGSIHADYPLSAMRQNESAPVMDAPDTVHAAGNDGTRESGRVRDHAGDVLDL